MSINIKEKEKDKIVWNLFFLLLIALPVLIIYKYVYDFRINQAVIINILVFVMFTFYLLLIIKKGEFSYKISPLNFPLFMFVLTAILSLLINNNLGLNNLKENFNLLSYFLIYFLVINNLRNKDSFYFCIKIFLIVTSIVSIYLLIQYYELDPFLYDITRLTSTLGNRNYIANYLALVFPINFALFLIVKKKKKKIFYETALIINYTGIIICHTRAIWAALFFSFLFSVFLIFKFKVRNILKENKKWLILLFSLFLIITIIYSVDNPLNRSSISATERAASAFDMQGSSLKTRFLIWQSTLNMIKNKPLFGLGVGSFPLNYLYYQADFLSQKPDYLKYNTKAAEAHNEYLQTWSEMGIIGLLFFLLFIYLFYYHSIKIIKELEKNEEKIILIGLISGITITLFHSIFSFPLHIPATSAAFWFIVGLTVVLEDMFLKKDRNSKIIKYRRIFFYSDNNKIIFNIFKTSIMIVVIFFIIILINTLIIKPYVAEIYYFSGMRDSVDKNYEKALSNFEYSAQLDNYNGRNLHALGTTYYNLKIYDKAEQVLQRAKNYITDVNTFYNLGLLYSQVGLYKKAENEFKYAVYLDPKHSKTFHNLGLLYFLEEDYDNAIEQWSKILEIDPNFPNKYIVLNNLGIVYKKKAMPDTALEYFLQALQLAPEGSPITDEIEEEIYDIYKGKLDN